VIACATPAVAHDANSWGGLFRSRDDGEAWLSADAGLFVGAALAVAVSPTDATHLLYGTDTSLLRSRNAGRDWVAEAPRLFQGPTLAVEFSADGNCAWAATPGGIFVACGGANWQRSDVPDDAIPGRAFASGSSAARVYLLGARGLYASADHGRTFDRIGARDLPDAAGRALLRVSRQAGSVGSVGSVALSGPVGSAGLAGPSDPADGLPPDALFAVFDGRIWASFDQGGSWAPRDAGLPRGRIETITSDTESPGRLWAASSNRLHVSDDLGATWRPWGAPISEANLTIRSMATARAGSLVVLATHKGVIRSHDGGNTWAQVEGALPVHLEAGPLLRDPHDAQTMYSGFSLVPYAEFWRRAEQGANLLSRFDPVSLAGAAAFLLLLLIGGWSGARRLALAYRDT
jgi:photosystem II stability/assembly factor-like uncharacterized protein